MNSLIDFKKFDKMNYHVAKDINKLIYHFSNDYPLNLFPEIIEYFRKNITCKSHLDYKDKCGETSILPIYISNLTEFSITCNMECDTIENLNEYMVEEIFLMYLDYYYWKNNDPISTLHWQSNGISNNGAYLIWSNLTNIFDKLYQFNETDTINFHDYIHNNIYEIVDYRYN